MVLNVATSVVDFLKQRGFKPSAGDKFPLFQQRGQLFNQLGLNSKLGDFVGSGEQNTALLNQLSQRERNLGIRVSPENILDVIQQAQSGAQQVPPQATAQQAPPVTAQQTLQQGQQQPSQAPQQGGTSLEDVQSFLFGGVPGVPSALDPSQQLTPQQVAQEAQNRVFGSTDFQFASSQRQADLAQTRLSAQQQREDLIKNLASRGLFFSGQKKTGETAINADEVANILGIDRNFARVVAQGLESAAQDIAKEAQEGKAEALESLASLGFTVVNGKVVPTLEARQTALQQFQSLRKQETQEQQFQQQFGLQQQKLALDFAKAEQNVLEADREFQLNIAKFQSKQQQDAFKNALDEAKLALDRAKTASTIEKNRVIASIAFEKLQIERDKLETAGNLSAAAEKELRQISNVELTVNELKSQIQNLPSGRIAGLLGNIQGLSGFNDQISAYNAFRKSSIGPIARAISQEVGVLTDKDVKRAEELLPSSTDTAGEREQKFQTLETLIEAKKDLLSLEASLGTSALLNTSGVDLDSFGFEEE